jgi:hypothetical protein
MASKAAGRVLGLCLVTLVGVLSACEGEGGPMAVLDIDPKVGATAGDQPIRILGQNFRSDIGYTVYFGAKKGKSVTILNPETILVVTPTGVDPGTVDIQIRADDGNAFKVPQVFKFEEMGGSVVEGLGEAAKEKEKGNLAF